MSLNRIFPTIVPFDITAGNALIDSTTDNAFIAPVGVDLSPYRGKLMELWSGSTLWAQAWISATAPGGEALDATNLLSTLDFTGVGWGSMVGNWTAVDADTFTTNPAGSGRNYTLPTSTNALYKTAITGTSSSGTLTFANANNSVYYKLSTTAFGDARYVTASSVTGQIWGTSAATTIDINKAASYMQKVTMPAATGALLLSTKGGSRGWAYKHASFNPNAALTMRILAKRKVSGNGSYLV